MGLDLWIAVGVIAATSGLAFVAGRRLSRKVYQRRSYLFSECLVFSLVFAFGFSNTLRWASLFPTPAAICWSNWLPIMLGFVSGLASNAKTMRTGSRPIVASLLAMLSAAFLVSPVVLPWVCPIQTDRAADWQDGVCLQSHESSCGAAAAATLLHQMDLIMPAQTSGRIGIREGYSNAEQMMAQACLTSHHGTSVLGLIRGLRIATEGSNCRVRIGDSSPSSWIINRQLPNIVVVQFPGQSDGRFESVRRLLGTDGEGHAVVVVGRDSDGMWRVADPAVGWQLWTDEELRTRFTGEAIYLAQR
ncbi:MAG: hypothetical protein AAF802_19650 [Planctomycetota bacterium]